MACNRTHSVRVGFTCPHCGPVEGILDVLYDYDKIRRLLTRKSLTQRPFSHWRYRELLPIPDKAILPSLLVGWTPLTEAPSLARHLNVRMLHLKDDGRNPTGSLKDRASSVGAVLARHRRMPVIACASTGNAASSLAGMSASLRLRSVIFVPERAPDPKVTQLLIFGATVFRVLGGYEDAFRISQQAGERYGWYNRNCAINPYLIEGKKTVGLEIAEQLAWQVPDWVTMSVGDGCSIAGLWKAFRELKILGLIDRTPRILGVQAEGAAPVTEAFRTGAQMRSMTPHTVADSIAVGVPRNWRKAVLAVRESGGTMINVSDDEILDAMRYCGRLTGIFAEPAAATAIAGLKRAVEDQVVTRRSSAVAIISGNGLKDIRSAQTAAGQPFELAADGDGLEKVLHKQGLLTEVSRD